MCRQLLLHLSGRRSVRPSVSQRALVSVKEKETLICSSVTNASSCLSQKEYLKSLGNSECSPQTFLENSSNLDKLLIIIQNEDIAAHVHKVESPHLTSPHRLFGGNLLHGEVQCSVVLRALQGKLCLNSGDVVDSSPGVLEEVTVGELRRRRLSGRRQEPHLQRALCFRGLHRLR